MGFGRFFSWYVKPMLWRIANPGRHVEDYYAESIASRLERGRRHPAIGAQTRTVREPTELLDVLRLRGLAPHQGVVDYGCGSFRLGKALIHYLDPGRYWGLDVTDQFFSAGYNFLGEELTREKRPNARVINPAGLAEAQRHKPDFIVSWHVCSKVPPSRFADYFGKMIGLMHPGTRVLVHFPETTARRRLSRFSWATPRAAIEKAIRDLDPKLEVRFELLTSQIHKGVSQTMVEFAYPQAGIHDTPLLVGRASAAE
ncbi:MAG TPA: hypothetical protein VGM59_09255 [Dongiaceae bacterium]